MYWSILCEEEIITGPPPPAILPPVRRKLLPLTVDCASCTFDQARRIQLYEQYRALGLDTTSPFVIAQYPELAGAPWKYPSTIVLRCWSEAVDGLWNILKQQKPGAVITIDASLSPEWAGDYEVMEIKAFPFQGDSSQLSTGASTNIGTGRSSASLVQPASADSGTLELTLRAYDERVFFDVSDTPTYGTVPGVDLDAGGW
jgi:hypothetical protein